jgi:hypothetical protein
MKESMKGKRLRCLPLRTLRWSSLEMQVVVVGEIQATSSGPFKQSTVTLFELGFGLDDACGLRLDVTVDLFPKLGSSFGNLKLINGER